MKMNLNTKGVIVLGSTSSDPHVVPLFLLKMLLEENGYRVVNLRCFNAPETFVSAAQDHADVRAIIIANNNGAACEDLQGLREALAGAGKVPVILGGRYRLRAGPAVGCTLRALGVTHFCDDFDQLLHLLATQEEQSTCLIPA